MGTEGVEDAYIFFSPSIEILKPPSATFQNFITTVGLHPIAFQRWLMASLVTRFYFLLISLPSNQRINFCIFVKKVNKIAETARFPGNFVHKVKLLELIMMSQLIFFQERM